MHELSLAMSVSAIVRHQMENYPDGRLSAIEIEVGQQSGVDIPSFKTAMESVIRTSPWPQAEIELTIQPAKFQCLDCGKQFGIPLPDPAEYFPQCPYCNSRQSLPVSGRDFRLKAVRLDT